MVRREGNKQVARDQKRIITNCGRTMSGGGYITRRSGERERITTYDNKAKTRETRDAKHWSGTEEGGEEEGTKSRMQNQKEGGLGVSHKRVARI